ncbi:hypothetical protein GCM10009623_02600 [Nocardioides aestuarii]|uniref:DUF1097 domain-containing protein n=1 Tax=Nocardioides aestuarii TaxID=252231 RepID=A0ABW4TJG3_9ACTN
MRKTLISGLLLVAAAFLTVLLGDWLDLDVESVALLGVAAGAVVALVPDAGVGRRLAGFALGVVVTLVGYLVRAAVLPDTTGGRAVFAALVVGLLVVVAAVSLGRLPLWSGLLGAATFAGAFEATYTLAPPRVVENATNTITGLVLCIAVGFAAASLAAPARERATETTPHRDEVLEDAQ